MKKQLLILMVLFAFIGLSVKAQNKMVQADPSKIIGTTLPSNTMIAACKGLVNPPTADLKWRPLLTKKTEEYEPLSPNQELIEKIKAEKLKLKSREEKSISSEKSIETVVPVVGTNYLGNTNDGSSPLDNSMAISNAGLIVSVANSTIEYDTYSGSTTYYNNLLTLVNIVDAGITGVCDPVVIYDQGSDRFIAFCQSTPLTSPNKIFLFFSQTNDPASGWWIYELNGDPTGNADGFDYPKLGVSTNELFVTGNLFYTSGGFHQAIIFQIDKTVGYAGGSFSFNYYQGITGSPFTILPVSYGQGGSYGPGITLVSNDNSGGSTINLYQITNDICCSPVINYWSVATTAYSPAANAYQSGSSTMLQTGDCRILSGFYLYNSGTGVGTVHFVFHSAYAGGSYHGLNYNRLNLGTLANVSSVFGLSGFDYCYPSVVSFSTSGADNSVMVGFGRTGSTIFPEERVVNCDNSMNWSGSTLVKSSSSYVSYTSTTAERWGDYTGTSRKHNASSPEIWMTGSFGNSSNVWDAWNAQIYTNSSVGVNENSKLDNMKVFPNPIIETFNLEFTLNENSNIEINIFDVAGKLIKQLYSGKGIQGENVFSFNKANLSSGTYFINIKNNLNIIKNEKIIITN